MTPLVRILLVVVALWQGSAAHADARDSWRAELAPSGEDHDLAYAVAARGSRGLAFQLEGAIQPHRLDPWNEQHTGTSLQIELEELALEYGRGSLSGRVGLLTPRLGSASVASTAVSGALLPGDIELPTSRGVELAFAGSSSRLGGYRLATAVYPNTVTLALDGNVGTPLVDLAIHLSVLRTRSPGSGRPLRGLTVELEPPALQLAPRTSIAARVGTVWLERAGSRRRRTSLALVLERRDWRLSVLAARAVEARAASELAVEAAGGWRLGETAWIELAWRERVSARRASGTAFVRLARSFRW